MAAKELSAHYKVTVLEARSEPGGRIRTTYLPGNTKHIEQGAEFVHGRLPVTMQLLREAGLSVSPVQGEIYHVKDGNWQRSSEMIEGWDDLIKKMEAEPDDMTMLAFLQKHYSDEKHFALRKHITRYAEGFDLADISRVSLKALLYEWTNEPDENFRVDKGYMSLIRFMEEECKKAGCTILYNTPVKLIEWSKGHVKAFTDPDNAYEASKVLITIPLGLLQSREAIDAIRFGPAIDDYLDATQEMGYGSIIKFVLQFSHRFWDTKERHAGFIISEETVPTWWTQQADDLTLTGWLGGTPADEWINAGKDQLLSIAIHSLSNIFQLSFADIRSVLVSSHIFNWAHDEWADGGYSYLTPATPAVQQLFDEPPGDTIFFAGEAFYQGPSPGTVEAALVSGQTAANKLLLR